MFLKKCDMISPPITLSFKGEYMHSSIFSGILTIIIHIITLAFGIYYILQFINKEKPTAYFYNRFINDAGKFTLNSSSLFHYLYLINKKSQYIINFDFDMIRIVGLEEINIESYYSSIDLETTPHWIYGFCNNDTDTKGISYLINNKEEFDNSVCIRKYYNPNTKQYYDTTDNNNFIWPSIEHGMSHVNSTFYGIIIEKCKNDNLRQLLGLNNCKNDDIIDNYIYSSGIVLKLIDHYSDVLNYKEPFKKYFYSISNLLYPKSYTINNMNFNPALIKTHNGIILDNVVEESSYLFSQNEKVTMDEEVEIKDEEGKPIYDEDGEKVYKSTGIVSSYYFWMQNRLQYYERNYQRLQDILSEIGGLSRTLFIIANMINLIVSNYITLLDTEDFILSVDNTNYYNEKIKNQKPIMIYKKEENLFPPKRIYSYNNQNYLKQSSTNQRLNKENDNILDNKNIEETIQQNKYSLIKKNNFININTYNTYNNINKEENDKVTKNFEIKNEKEKRYNYRKRNKLKINQFKPINNDTKKEDINNPIKKQNFNWFKYIWYKIRCSKNNPMISYYEDYRTKLISEESLITGQLDIYRLAKICKLECKNDLKSL